MGVTRNTGRLIPYLFFFPIHPFFQSAGSPKEPEVGAYAPQKPDAQLVAEKVWFSKSKQCPRKLRQTFRGSRGSRYCRRTDEKMLPRTIEKIRRVHFPHFLHTMANRILCCDTTTIQSIEYRIALYKSYRILLLLSFLQIQVPVQIQVKWQPQH
jgi:hypothetical protein